MIKGIYTVARGMDYSRKNIEAVANNIANMNSTGYKKEGDFQQILNSVGKTEVRQIRDYSQGNLVSTESPLDLAIKGNGFFEVNTPNGIELTRNGKFQISDDGFLVDSEGNKVMGSQGEINFSNSMLNENQKITIDRSGEIKIGDQIVDVLKISAPANLQDLEKTGASNYTSQSGDYVPVSEDNFSVLSGYVEESNVNPVIEMEKMIQINKDYEASQKVVNAIDSSLDRLKEVGRVL